MLALAHLDLIRQIHQETLHHFHSHKGKVTGFLHTVLIICSIDVYVSWEKRKHLVLICFISRIIFLWTKFQKHVTIMLEQPPCSQRTHPRCHSKIRKIFIALFTVDGELPLLGRPLRLGFTLRQLIEARQREQVLTFSLSGIPRGRKETQERP